MSVAPRELPVFRRATARDAVDVATQMFEDCQRVDMQTLAERLGVSRATLYRWVGDRDQLLDQVAARTARTLWIQARLETQGEPGFEHYLASVTRFMELSMINEPVVSFATRESALALRIFLDPDSRVASRLRQALQMQWKEDVPGSDVPDEVFAMLGLSATALVWANVATGHQPHIQATTGLFRAVLATQLTTPVA